MKLSKHRRLPVYDGDGNLLGFCSSAFEQKDVNMMLGGNLTSASSTEYFVLHNWEEA